MYPAVATWRFVGQAHFRELNSIADGQATAAVLGTVGEMEYTCPTGSWQDIEALRLWCDGGRRQGVAGAGYYLEGAVSGGRTGIKWYGIFQGAINVGEVSVTVAEAIAIKKGLEHLQRWSARSLGGESLAAAVVGM